MGYAVPSELFSMLAQSEALPDRWSRDVGAAADALGSIGTGVKTYKTNQRQKKLDQFFDTSVPTPILNRVLPGAPADGSITYRDLGGLSGAGLSSMLKSQDTAADPMTLSVLASGGDPDKASRLYQMFTQKDASGNTPSLKVNSATVNAAKLMRPPKPARGGSASPEVQTLKALQQTYSKQLSGDISESERKTAQANLTAINNRLAKLGGVTLQDVPPAPTPAPNAASAPAGAPAAAPAKTTSSVIQQLLSALSK